MLDAISTAGWQLCPGGAQNSAAILQDRTVLPAPPKTSSIARASVTHVRTLFNSGVLAIPEALWLIEQRDGSCSAQKEQSGRGQRELTKPQNRNANHGG